MHVSQHFRHGSVTRGALVPYLEVLLVDPSHEDARRGLVQIGFAVASPVSLPNDQTARAPARRATINQDVLGHG